MGKELFSAGFTNLSVSTVKPACDFVSLSPELWEYSSEEAKAYAALKNTIYDKMGIDFSAKDKKGGDALPAKLFDLKLAYYIGLLKGDYVDELEFLLYIEGHERYKDALEIMCHIDTFKTMTKTFFLAHEVHHKFIPPLETLRNYVADPNNKVDMTI